MWITSWPRRRTPSRASYPLANRRPRARFRPQLEPFEDRLVPSTLTVTSPFDNGSAGTLRYEIAAALSGDTIVFAPNLYSTPIYLNGTELAIDKNLDIEWSRSADFQMIISGNYASRVFEVSAGVQATITGLTIVRGSDPVVGGGIRNHGALTLTACNLFYNSAAYAGGGIQNDNGATLTINSCDISWNTTSVGVGGAINNNGGMVTILDSTLHDNIGTDSGGTIYNGWYGTLTITDSTLSHNIAPSGGAIYNDTYGIVTLSGSSVTRNNANRSGGAGIYNDGQLSVLNKSTVTHNYGADLFEGPSGSFTKDKFSKIGKIAS